MTIKEATQLSQDILIKVGFGTDEAALITQNLIEAELAGKKTHGLVRLPAIVSNVLSGKIRIDKEAIEVISEFPASLHLNAQYKSGFYVMYKSLEMSLKKVKQSGLVAVAIKDLSYATGYIGDYARRAAEQDVIFIGFHNSPGGLVPFGTTEAIWGTDPITIGIPTHRIPVILDMASSQCTWGDVLIAKTEGRMLKPGVAIDADGELTIDPVKAMEGGILPIAGHKGSGLAFIVELLSGGLSNSRVGSAVEGGWGSFYMLIDPKIFRDLNDFKDDVKKAIDELKNASKAKDVKEVYFPGEQSYLKRKKSLETNIIEVSEKQLAELNSLLRGLK